MIRLPLLDCREKVVGAYAVMSQNDGFFERIVAGALYISKAQAFGLVCNAMGRVCRLGRTWKLT